LTRLLIDVLYGYRRAASAADLIAVAEQRAAEPKARVQPLPLIQAAPLPMISMELSAPPAPVVQPQATPPKPVETPKPEKPKPLKKKTKPKPKKKAVEKLVKATPDPAPAETSLSPPASAAVPTQNKAAPAAPHNDAFTPANSNAAYLHNPAPVYPMTARRRYWQGTVVLCVYIGADGHVQKVSAQRSSGHDVLDDLALDAVRQWRFGRVELD
jgi:protein TonB